MATQDELLQRIAAAAMPRKLGNLFSRYGEPAPILGRGRAPILGRERATAPTAGGLAGRPGSSQQLGESTDQEEGQFDRYEDLPDPRDEMAARQEREDAAGDADYQESLGRLQTLGRQLGVGTGELEDMKNRAPDLTEDEARQYLADKAKSPNLTWEDWLDQRNAEFSGE